MMNDTKTYKHGKDLHEANNCAKCNETNYLPLNNGQIFDQCYERKAIVIQGTKQIVIKTQVLCDECFTELRNDKVLHIYSQVLGVARY